MESEEKHNAGVEIGRCVFLFFTFEELKCSNDVPACQARSVFAASVWQLCCFYLYLNFNALRYRQRCFFYRSLCISVELTQQCWSYILSDLSMCNSRLSHWYILPAAIFKESSFVSYIQGDSRHPPRCRRRSFKTQCRQDYSELCIALTTTGLEQYSAACGLIMQIFSTVLLKVAVAGIEQCIPESENNKKSRLRCSNLLMKL